MHMIMEQAYPILEDVLRNETSLVDIVPHRFHFETNVALAEEEVKDIEEFLFEPTQQLSWLQAEVSYLKTRLDCLQRKAVVLEGQVKKCRSLITSIRRLPDEILLEIFFHCLPKSMSPTMHSTSAPLLLTYVCYRWKNLALTTSKLWSAIRITIDSDLSDINPDNQPNNLVGHQSQPRHRHLPKFKDIISWLLPNVWINRSEALPLTFSLVSHWSLSRGDKAIVDKCFQTLLPLASRWENVFLGGHAITSLSSILNQASTLVSKFESLESLLLCVNNFTTIPDLAPMFNAPNLQKVVIQHAEIDSSTLTLPWSRLTHLDLSGPPSQNWLGPKLSSLSVTLNQCGSLIHLVIGINDPESLDLDIRKMSLPKLQRIAFWRPLGLESSKIFSVFVRNLEAGDICHISMFNFTGRELRTLLSYHGKGLRTLLLDTMDMTFKGEKFAKSLRYCPDLECLSLDHSAGDLRTVDEGFFSLFTETKEGGIAPPCPHLQELTLNGSIICKSLPGLISFLKTKLLGTTLRETKNLETKLLETKQDNGPGIFSPLRRFSINHPIKDFGRDLSEGLVKHKLRSFIEKGLVLEISPRSEIDSSQPYDQWSLANIGHSLQYCI